MLSGLRVILTGASGLTGYAIAHSLADKGIRLVLAGRNRKKLEQLKASLKTENAAEIWDGDLADEEGICARLIDFSAGVLGGIDVLIHNAGVFHFSDFHHINQDVLADLLDVNIKTPIWLTRMALPWLQKNKHAVVLMVSSIAGYSALPGGAVYAATKWALNGFAFSLREELRGGPVRICTLSPCQISVLRSSATPGIPVITPDMLADMVTLVIETSLTTASSLDVVIS